MTVPNEAVPFSEAAILAAEKLERAWSTHGGYYPGVRAYLAAAVGADPRLEACVRLAALSDEELVERVAREVAAGSEHGAAYLKFGDDHTSADHWHAIARAVLAVLGLPVAEREGP